MYYTGFTLDTREEVDSQVVVDFDEALSVYKDWKPAISPISIVCKKKDIPVCQADCCINEMIHDDAYIDQMLAEAFVQSLFTQQASEQPSLIVYPRPWQDIINVGYTFTEDELIIMTYRVFGFVLRNRKWGTSLFLFLFLC